VLWKKLSLLSVSFFLVACTTLPERVVIENAVLTESANFNLVDARPVEQIRGGKHEFTYATWWIYGDDRFSIPPMQLLKSELAKAFPLQLNGKVVRVEKFEISVSQTKGDRPRGNAYIPSSGSIGADLLGGVLAGLLINAIESQKSSMLVGAVIRMDIDGIKYEYTEKNPKGAEDIDRQLSMNLGKAIAGLVGEITKGLERSNQKIDKAATETGSAQ